VNFTRYRLRSPENTQPGAKSYEAVLRRRLAAGEPLKPPPPTPPSPTFAEFSSQWFETYVRTNNKPSSQRSRSHVLRNHLVPFFGRTRLEAITTARVEEYKARKIRDGLSPKTVNDHLGILGKSLHDAREWGVPAAAPTLRWLRAPKPAFCFLGRDEAQRLLVAMRSTRWRTMVTVALHTGLRLGELFGLRWQDIDVDRANIAVRQSIVEGVTGSPKNYRERHIPLNHIVLNALAAMPRTHDLVFHRGDGRPLTCSTAENALRRACNRASLRPIGWHALRHTYASWLASGGIPVPAIQALLGHSTIEMTMRYAHLAPSSLRQAADVLEQFTSAPGPSPWAPGGQRASISMLSSPLAAAA